MSTTAHVRNGRQASMRSARAVRIGGRLVAKVVAQGGQQPRLLHAGCVGRPDGADGHEAGVEGAQAGQRLDLGTGDLRVQGAQPCRVEQAVEGRPRHRPQASILLHGRHRQRGRIQDRLRGREGAEARAGQLERGPQGLPHAAAQRVGLAAGPVAGEDGPRRGLVRRVVQHRPEARVARLEPPDERVALADRGPAAAVVIQGDDAGDLVAHGRHVRGAMDLADDRAAGPSVSTTPASSWKPSTQKARRMSGTTGAGSRGPKTWLAARARENGPRGSIVKVAVTPGAYPAGRAAVSGSAACRRRPSASRPPRGPRS